MRLFCMITASLTVLSGMPTSNAATITVGTIGELVSANSTARPGDTISLKEGTYRVQSYGITVKTNNLTFRGETGTREKVIITGAGMNGAIEYGFWISGSGVTIRDLTIQEVHYHCIQTDVNNDGLQVINCILRDANEQLLKIPFSASNADYSENGVVERCLFEFSAGVANQYYTGGVDGHYCKNWIIRNNTFRNIRSPDNQIAEHAVHFWSQSTGTLVESNRIINCDRGIGFGLGDRGHTGGIIRNNMIYHAKISGIDNGDAGIILETSPGTKVYNNTIYFENDYPNAIEYRFSATTGVEIRNNLANRLIRQRDGAAGTVNGNIENAQSAWFRQPSAADLHLTSIASAAIDKGADISGLTVDIDGDPRAPGSIDVGADEFNAASINAPRRFPEKYSTEAHAHGGRCALVLFRSGQRSYGSTRRMVDVVGKDRTSSMKSSGLLLSK